MSASYTASHAKIVEAVQAMLADPQGFGDEQLVGGGAIERVEARLREWYGVEHCLLVDNATNGLLALALAAGLTERTVIVPPQSYGATYGPLRFLNDNLIFAEPDDNGNASPESINRLMDSETAAVWATDWRGKAHDTAGIAHLCAARGVPYFADAASSLGIQTADGPASSHADAWVVSFGPHKPLYCGEGGAILTRNPTLYEHLVRLTQHPHRYRREFSLADHLNEPFLNARIHPIAAVIAEETLTNLLG